MMTRQQAIADSHWRAQRGVSCHLAGRCRLAIAFQQDKEIIPRVVLAVTGARVAVNFYRDADFAANVVTRIEASGGIARAFQVDVRDRAATEGMVAAVHDAWGSVDILILNADV